MSACRRTRKDGLAAIDAGAAQVPPATMPMAVAETPVRSIVRRSNCPLMRHLPGCVVRLDVLPLANARVERSEVPGDRWNFRTHRLPRRHVSAVGAERLPRAAWTG